MEFDQSAQAIAKESGRAAEKEQRRLEEGLATTARLFLRPGVGAEMVQGTRSAFLVEARVEECNVPQNGGEVDALVALEDEAVAHEPGEADLVRHRPVCSLPAAKQRSKSGLRFGRRRETRTSNYRRLRIAAG